MDRFEYDITQHASDTFDKVVYFCSKSGQCGIEEIAMRYRRNCKRSDKNLDGYSEQQGKRRLGAGSNCLWQRWHDVLLET